MNRDRRIPVIDLFAGPGGLGEGFSALHDPSGRHPFRIGLSIEMEKWAHETLELRAFFRQFHAGEAPDEYYSHISGKLAREELFAKFKRESEAAAAEALQIELNQDNAPEIRKRIAAVLGSSRQSDAWVLIGGPPCQAYSVVGRSRNRGIKGYTPEGDRRTTLYVEYLQILADHAPPVFVMENVKGLLSARLHSKKLFDHILADLRAPARAIQDAGRTFYGGQATEYKLIPLAPASNEVPAGRFGTVEPADFLVRCERHGVPQARHRVIVLGIRSDLAGLEVGNLNVVRPVAARSVLDGLPRLRSGLSSDDSADRWVAELREARCAPWMRELRRTHEKVAGRVEEVLDQLTLPAAGRGGEFTRRGRAPKGHAGWYQDPKLTGTCNHSARGHIPQDLHRYLFAACFADVLGASPDLREFPEKLLPAHQNAHEALAGGPFSDRFRVQVASKPATTVTSHISKDGHYYIHHDPTQCRSLTVREAARLQTFPDNYFFCGSRTAQYIQVGNAVPPLLARQIAELVHGLLG